MKVSLVVPAFNEESNLKPLVKDIQGMTKKHKLDYEIILVNDNSSDSTLEIIDKLAKAKRVQAVHRIKGHNGMGNALIDGTKKAKGDIIVWVMADRSDNLETIPKMIKKIKQGNDMVFGSRYIPGGSSGDLDKTKALASSGYSRLAKFFFGLRVNDITNAFRAFKKSVFNKIKLDSGDFAISPEFAIKAHLRGFRLTEVPTTYSNRIAGKTKFKMMKMGLKYLSLLRFKFFY
ncbi:MAG: Glycosyltransferase AglD [Candidatus Woesearchaeota archaeon]|nr:Glycosyltransferase AglD [Candidatus Woesearchaeota archaeon]